MIINGTMQNVYKAYADAVPVKKKIAESHTPSAGRKETDEVVLSKEAQSFHQILQQAKEGSEVRMDRVSALSKQIEAGAYSPGAREIAEKLLSYRY